MSTQDIAARVRGSIVALVTPFRDGAVDERGLRDLVAWHLDQGTHGIVPCGTTGESPTLGHDEHKRVVDLCVEAVGGRIPVIAGTGSNNTVEAVDFTRHAKAAGADAALVVTPYYNKPNQEGLYRHFKAIHDCAELPVIIYNIPPRSVVDMLPETMARLVADCPRIIGVKDATADLARPLITRQLCGTAFRQVSGEDATALAFNAQGGVGCISVTANVAPGLCARMQDAFAAGDIAEAMALNHRLAPLHKVLFQEPNPVPSKFALKLLGLIDEEVRSPLAPLAEPTRAAVEEAMRASGVLN